MSRITEELKLHSDGWCNDPGADGVASYDPADPLAVRLVIWRSKQKESVTWEFALDLLWPWNPGQPGGDVEVTWLEDTVELEFSPPSGYALVYIDKTRVTAFLDRVRDAMPNDAELESYFDRAVEEIGIRALGMDGHRTEGP